MNINDILKLSALEIGRLIKLGEISVAEVTSSSLDYIAQNDCKYNAFITVNREKALAEADLIQRKISCGEITSPLAGVPMAVKDNICTKNIRTTCASKMLNNHVPIYNATVIERLNQSGAVLLGKLNMDEFAMGSTGESSYYGTALNPNNINHVCGGSSSGAAAAVSSNMAYYALGSDTGGSIRTPCSHCGVYGIKPTYGRISRYGLIAYASSFDQIGPIARTTLDLAAVLDEISGYDIYDSTCAKRNYNSLLDQLDGNIKGLRIGIINEFLSNGIDDEVKNCILSAAHSFEQLGCDVEYLSLPQIDLSLAAYYIIALAQASSNLARYDGIRYGYQPENCDNLNDLYVKSRSEGFGNEVKRRIMLGNFILSSGYYDKYYLKALKAQTIIKQAFDAAFAKYDILLCPTAPTTAPKVGSTISDPLKMYLSDIYTVGANLAGLPTLTAPCGFDGNNMPVGMQLIGKHFDEATLLNASYAYEKYIANFSFGGDA